MAGPKPQKKAKNHVPDAHTNGARAASAAVREVEEAPVLNDVRSCLSVQPILKRPCDLYLVLVYLACFAVAAMHLYAGCKGKGMKFGKFFDPVCAPLAQVEAKPVLAIYTKWYKDVQTAPRGADDFWLLVTIAVNGVLAPLLAPVMFFGASKNSYQNVAIVHATVNVLVTLQAFLGGAWVFGQVGHAFYAVALASSLVLLNRWWNEHPFVAKSGACSFGGGMCSLLRFAVQIGFTYLLATSIVTLYDWALGAHDGFKHYTRLSPLCDAYTALAQKQVSAVSGEALVHVKAAWAIFAEQLASVGKIVMAKVKEFQK
eukprot:TRINITY_DN8111_c0_g1_i1.p1 TRINITY_DN8111_c0_g1~~TRINITY_DN8111_c0_g1_i1.p1  ORF type:complete len:315 (+),score=88.75 TRINITY_DN8111_c0_g1_i1:319-1263(+)